MTDKKMNDELTNDLAALMMHLYENDDVREELMLLCNKLTSPIEKAIRMDLRDYFAGQVVGMFTGDSTWDERAAAAYALADAMMKARDGGADE